jgi:hypothetical protein
MYKAIKENKIIAVNDSGEFPCLVYDEVVEDNQHQVADFVMVESEFILKTDEKAIEQQKEQVREVRNGYLQATDIYMIADFPISEEDRGSYRLYRMYLRNYTQEPNWWEENPVSYEEWHHVVEFALAEE